MKRFHLFEQRLRVSLLPLIIAACALASTVRADDSASKNTVTNAPAAAPLPAKPAEARPTETKAVIRKITGAELYAINCNRCHPERYANERTPAQWETIMLHMRVRANLPAEQAREIVRFLQEDSGD
jgi:cytochrome c1